MSKVKCLPIADLDAAIRAYYGGGYIGNKEIGRIFGKTSSSTIQSLKRPVAAEEKARDLPVYVPAHVSVKIAFEVWGIDIKELERNRKKMQELGL